MSVRPVIDLGEELANDSYVPAPKLREQVMVRDEQCVFPWCGRRGRDHDLDHVEEFDPDGPPGQTASLNLARLCRYHHRLKTHGRWRYVRASGEHAYLWTSPLGEQWRVTSRGTEPVLPEITEVEPGLGDPDVSAALDRLAA